MKPRGARREARGVRPAGERCLHGAHPRQPGRERPPVIED